MMRSHDPGPIASTTAYLTLGELAQLINLTIAVASQRLGGTGLAHVFQDAVDEQLAACQLASPEGRCAVVWSTLQTWLERAAAFARLTAGEAAVSQDLYDALEVAGLDIDRLIVELNRHRVLTLPRLGRVTPPCWSARLACA